MTLPQNQRMFHGGIRAIALADQLAARFNDRQHKTNIQSQGGTALVQIGSKHGTPVTLHIADTEGGVLVTMSRDRAAAGPDGGRSANCWNARGFQSTLAVGGDPRPGGRDDEGKYRPEDMERGQRHLRVDVAGRGTQRAGQPESLRVLRDRQRVRGRDLHRMRRGPAGGTATRLPQVRTPDIHPTRCSARLAERDWWKDSRQQV